MEFIRAALQKDITKKIITIIILCIFFYLMRNLLNLFLLTFLLTFLVSSFQNIITYKLSRYVKVNQLFATITIYFTIITIAILLTYKYVPIIVHQILEVANELANFKVNYGESQVVEFLTPLMAEIDIKSYVKEGAGYIIKFSTLLREWGFNIVVALILSMFFMVEKDKIIKFVSKFEHSRISWFYINVKYIGINFLNTFGKVIQAQVMIATVNAVLSVISLSIMGFPQLLGIGVMIFVLGLVPVAGVIISLIPLCVIAFNIGGYMKVIYILLMIIVLHAIESYFLNPKFMAVKTKLPVFFIFTILIVSETFMGIWGLLLGIPLFMFLLDLLNVSTLSNEK